MTWLTGFLAYFVIWWITLFGVLSQGIARAHQQGDIHAQRSGAPARPEIKRKMILTSLWAGVIWMIGYGLLTSGFWERWIDTQPVVV